MYTALARRFTVCDDWHASLLGPTYPNREYLLSAQSGGNDQQRPARPHDGFQWDTIVDRLAAGGRLGRPSTTATSRRWCCSGRA